MGNDRCPECNSEKGWGGQMCEICFYPYGVSPGQRMYDVKDAMNYGLIDSAEYSEARKRLQEAVHGD